MLEAFHFDRLRVSLKLVQIREDENLAPSKLVAAILQLCRLNECGQQARVRLAVFRGDDNLAGYSIEAVPLDETVNQWQEAGLEIVLYPYARKSTDAFANLKSANFLPYVLAGRYAVERSAGDALLLNSHNRLCDSTKANLFLIKGKNIYTPALHEGCVNGVMRRIVIEQAKRLGFRVHLDEVEETQLLSADEVFLTNAIQIIRWVERYKTARYGFTQTYLLFEAVKATIFSGLC